MVGRHWHYHVECRDLRDQTASGARWPCAYLSAAPYATARSGLRGRRRFNGAIVGARAKVRFNGQCTLFNNLP